MRGASPSGAFELLFVYGQRALVPELIVRWNGSTYEHYRVIADQVGSVRRIINAETGVTVYTADYSPFGVVVAESGVFDQPFGFAGGMRDSLTGLTRFGARDYDPQVGRWTSKDPIRFDGGLNLYEYAAGAPQMYVDPTGLNPLTPLEFWGVVAGGVLGAGFGAYSGYQEGGTAGAVEGFVAGGVTGAGVALAHTVSWQAALALGTAVSGLIAYLRGDNVAEGIVRGSAETALGLGVARCVAGPLGLPGHLRIDSGRWM